MGWPEPPHTPPQEGLLPHHPWLRDLDGCLCPLADPPSLSYRKPALHAKCRWDGRPKTPPFQWGAAGEVLPPHDQWLKDFDGAVWGLDKLVEPALLQQNPNFLERDLKETRDVLLQWAGALQGIFTIYQLQVRLLSVITHLHTAIRLLSVII